MDLVLAVLILGGVEVVVLGLAFRAFERADDRRVAADRPGPVTRATVPGRFFADSTALPAADREPLDAVLLQLERHVRLEQAAAESFLHNPTTESLHHPTASPLRLAN
jgi:hypothetical protein